MSDVNGFGPNWHDARCGHNFPIRECPYSACEAKANARQLDEEIEARRFLTIEEQRIMHRALLRSTRLVAKG